MKGLESVILRVLRGEGMPMKQADISSRAGLTEWDAPPGGEQRHWIISKILHKMQKDGTVNQYGGKGGPWSLTEKGRAMDDDETD